tara:strand:+ start:335 stop:514 length:180 start_codon:yes stop_codon:yes gene_type:complete
MSKRVILERNGSEIEVWDHQAEHLISKGWQQRAAETTKRWQIATQIDDVNQEEDDDGES